MLSAQSNVRSVIENIDVWANQLLFERKEGKKENLIQLEDHVDRVRKRYEQVQQSAQEIEQMLENNYRLYSNIPLEEPKQITDELVSHINRFTFRDFNFYKF